MVAFVNSRVFIGLPLSGDEVWIESSINYALHVGALQQAAQRYNHIIRPFIIPFLPEVRAIRRDLEAVREFLRPLVDNAVKRNSENTDHKDDERTAGFISSMLKYHGNGQTAVERVGINQMVVCDCLDIERG
jgi:hypothetical protein